MTSQSLPEIGTLVTVRVVDEDGAAHSYHGTFQGTSSHLTRKDPYGRDGREYTRYPDEEALRPELGEPATYARIYSATGGPMVRGDLAHTGPDHWFSMFDLHVNLDSANVTMTEATAAGRQWVEGNLSLDARRARLVAQVTALDPTLGETVDRLIEDINDAAYERGQDAEWRANHW